MRLGQLLSYLIDILLIVLVGVALYFASKKKKKDKTRVHEEDPQVKFMKSFWPWSR